MSDGQEKPVSEILLEVLACPVCKTRVEIAYFDKGKPGLKCTGCGKVYPVRNGIPVMLESESFDLKNGEDK